jgi:hypothetical protein
MQSYFCLQVVILPPTVSRLDCLGVGPPSGAHDQNLITVGYLRSSCCGAPCLTRGRVCNLLVQFAVTHRSKSLRTKTIFCCLISDSPNLDGQVPVFMSLRNRVVKLYPRALDSLSSPLTSRSAAVKVFQPTSTRVNSVSQVKVQVNLRPAVNRPVCLGVGLPFGAHDQFFFRQMLVCYFCSALSDVRSGLSFVSISL